jgi:hypothetical protein
MGKFKVWIKSWVGAFLVKYSKSYRNYQIEKYEAELDINIELVAQIDSCMEGAQGEYLQFLVATKGELNKCIASLDDLLCVLDDAKKENGIENKSNGASRIFTSLLTVLFIGLKLTGYITWSWWWVLSPMWIPIVLLIATIGIVGIFVVVRDLIKK